MFSSTPITINVVTLTRKSCSERFHKNAKIGAIMDFAKIRLWPDWECSVRLIYAGRSLDPEATIEQYGIPDEATLHAVLEPIGSNGPNAVHVVPDSKPLDFSNVNVPAAALFAAQEAAKKYWPADRTAPAPEVIARELILALYAKAFGAKPTHSGCGASPKHDASSTLAFSLPPYLDLVWHEFILEVADYVAFCQPAFGFLLPHTSRTAADTEAVKQSRVMLTFTLRSQMPGAPEPNAWCWKSEHVLSQEAQADIDRLLAQEPVAKRTRNKKTQPPKNEQQIAEIRQKDKEKTIFQVFVKTLNGKTLTIRCTEGYLFFVIF
jgi:Ubiquitin family